MAPEEDPSECVGPINALVDSLVENGDCDSPEEAIVAIAKHRAGYGDHDLASTIRAHLVRP